MAKKIPVDNNSFTTPKINIGEIRNTEINKAIPLAIQELALMIVNRIFEQPEILDKLITLSELWIKNNLSKSHIESLLNEPTNKVSEDLMSIFSLSLNSLISEFSNLTE